MAVEEKVSEYNQKRLDFSSFSYDVDATDPERSTLLEFLVRSDLPVRTMNALIRYSAENSVPGHHHFDESPLTTIRDLYVFHEEDLRYIRNIGSVGVRVLSGLLHNVHNEGDLPLTDAREIAKRAEKAHEIFNSHRKITVNWMQRIRPY